MEKKFYHLGLEKDGVVDIFKPRVPESIMYEENDKIKRICLADSIKNCLNAVSWGKGGLYFNTNNKGESIPIIVYEFSNGILSENLVTPIALSEKKLVPDAMLTQEYWVINQNLIPDRTFYIVVKDIVMEEVNGEEVIKGFNYEQIDIENYIADYSFSFEIKLECEKDNLKKRIFDFLKDNICLNTAYENIEISINDNNVNVYSPYNIFYLKKEDLNNFAKSL